LQGSRVFLSLRPFPTRRSSDLIRFKGFDRLLSPIISARRLPRTGSRIERPGAKSTAPKMKMSVLDLRQRSILDPVRGSRLAEMRSEEHTSELQSHLNLVCHLLL